MSEDQDFEMWKNLLMISEALSETSMDKKANRDNLISQLATIEEVFAGSAEPVDDFKGYVVIHLCRSIRRAVDHI